ncbi:hypothetical protein ACH9L7_19745 (plasmid) [Haloferax sp. S1W]|uniref:hypothetical protein n=1 Tax=Haloferax sp. S1W TaxID=3377110 RepID=UPI0037C83D3C
MISENGAYFLSRCFADVSSSGEISQYPFSKSDITDNLDEANITQGDLLRGWKRFFNEVSRETHKEGVSIGDQKTVYYLDTDVIIEEWREEIESQTSYAASVIEDSTGGWSLIVKSEFHGELNFRIIESNVPSYEIDPLKKKFAVWFVEPNDLNQDENVFKWLDLLDGEFWDDFEERLDKNRKPRSADLFPRETTGAEDNFEGVMKRLRQELDRGDLDLIEDPRDDEHHLGQYFEGPVRCGSKVDEQSYLLVCECDQSNDIHLHFAKNNKPAKISESDAADTVRENIQDKLYKYNQLKSKKEDIPAVLKWGGGAIAALTAVQIAPLLSLVGLDPSSQNIQNILKLLPFITFLVGLSLVGYLLMPYLQFQRFEWESDGFWKKSDLLWLAAVIIAVAGFAYILLSI